MSTSSTWQQGKLLAGTGGDKELGCPLSSLEMLSARYQHFQSDGAVRYKLQNILPQLRPSERGLQELLSGSGFAVTCAGRCSPRLQWVHGPHAKPGALVISAGCKVRPGLRSSASQRQPCSLLPALVTFR